MVELAAAATGLAVTTAVLAVTSPAPARPRAVRPLAELVARWWSYEEGFAFRVGQPWLTREKVLALEVLGAFAGVTLGLCFTELAALAAAAGAGGAGLTRALFGVKAMSLRRGRQDAVLEAVRTLRGLLETGGVSVQQGLAVLAERGPATLREDFRLIVAAAAAGRQREAWAQARERLGEPLFDLLSAAILIQRPSGGELSPLFAELEQSVTAIHEVTREAEALQVQARSAAALMACLPLFFLVVLSALRSPYLETYHHQPGASVLAGLLGVIGATYLLMLRWLRLPQEPRLRVAGD